MKKQIAFICLALLSLSLGAKPVSVTSPNGKLKVTIETSGQISYTIDLGQQPILMASPISMTLEGGKSLGTAAKLEKQEPHYVDTKIKARAYRSNEIRAVYNELKLTFAGGYGLIYRAYDQGIAYRWFTTYKGKVKVSAEQATFNFPVGTRTLASLHDKGDNQNASFENIYTDTTVAGLAEGQLIYAPTLFSVPTGAKVVLTESDLRDYSGLWLTKKNSTIMGHFTPVVTDDINPEPDAKYKRRNSKAYANYIAEVSGDRFFPWRAAAVAEADKDLLNNDLVYALAEPSQIADPSWVKPGKAVWDWWHNFNAVGVDFKAGLNVNYYKAQIDFAAKHGLEYVVIDDGWATGLDDISKPVTEIELPALMAYAKAKKVDIILWATWWALDKDMPGLMAKYAAMGVKGFKVDFFDRSDQAIIQLQERMLVEAAKHKLVIDFHGVSKPTGLNRTYPNEINREAVLGSEFNKWSKLVTPRYQLQLPFIRGLAGHMDFTPGAMRNAQPRDFANLFNWPMSQGTRCHQLAMYLAYEAPLQMLCDAASVYEKENDAMAWVAKVPVGGFDESIVLDAKIGELLVIARRKGDTWYVSGMSGSKQAKDYALNLSFLRKQTNLDLWKDGLNADGVATDFTRKQSQIVRTDVVMVKLAANGGFVAVID